MEPMTYASKLTRLRPGQEGISGGILFVEGFSWCGTDFHLNNLLKLRWPETTK